MDPLDLKATKISPAREELGGVVFMKRTVDKIRAGLPGGHLGEYRMSGFSEAMITHLGLTEDALTKQVQAASDEAAVGEWVKANAKPAVVASWNSLIGDHRLDPDHAKKAFPFLADHPELEKSLDVLDEDDRRHYAGQ